jgi:hypothetical protein
MYHPIRSLPVSPVSSKIGPVTWWWPSVAISSRKVYTEAVHKVGKNSRRKTRDDRKHYLIPMKTFHIRRFKCNKCATDSQRNRGNCIFATIGMKRVNTTALHRRNSPESFSYKWASQKMNKLRGADDRRKNIRMRAHWLQESGSQTEVEVEERASHLNTNLLT